MGETEKERLRAVFEAEANLEKARKQRDEIRENNELTAKRKRFELAEITEEIANAQIKLTEAQAAATQTQGQIMIANLERQIQEMETWAGAVADLTAKGIDEGMLKEMNLMTPSALEEIQKMASMTDEELTKIAELYKTAQELATGMAVSELENMRLQTLEEIETLKSDYEEAFGGIGKITADSLRQGITEGIPEAVQAAHDLATGVTGGFKDEVQMASPSKSFVAIGENLIDSIILGQNNRKSDLFRNMMDIARSMVSQLNTYFKREGFNTGSTFFRSLGEGLIAEQAGLYQKAQETAAMIRAAFGGGGVGSYATGLNFVPRDDFPALLHYGEMVLPAQEASAYRSGETTGGSGQNIINQYFYGVREEQTPFEIYRQTQRAVATER